MYIPKHFQNNDLPEIESFIHSNGFALLVTTANNLPIASHIPIELKANKSGIKVLQGHLSRGNPQWKSLNEANGLAIFQGPHAYISSSWYNHVNVPTWNYIAVHVYGKIRIMSDEELYMSLSSLVDKYESGMEKPVTVDGMKEYAIQQMKGIVGIEMTIEKMEGKWKLSQNRDKEDFKNIITELEKLNDENAKLVAEEMKKINKI